MSKKEMAIANGVSVKTIPDTIKITAVFADKGRVPYRIRERRLELRLKDFSGNVTVEFIRIKQLPAATYMPLISE